MTNTFKKWGAVAAVWMAVAGCSNLTVSVDVLDPVHVSDAMFGERQHKTYADIVKAQPGQLKGQLTRRFRDFSHQFHAVLDRTNTLALRLADPSLAQSILALRPATAPDRQWYRDMASSGEALERIAADMRQTAARLQYRPRSPMPLELRSLLESFDGELGKESYRRDNSLRAVESDLKAAVERAARKAGQDAADAVCSPAQQPCSREQQNAATVARDKAVAEARRDLAGTDAVTQVQAAVAEANASAELRSIIGDGSLASTEYAYTVASAPDHLWRRDFNRAYASGMMGSSDMVIRLNSTADFSVKGMLFDASTVASVASKVTTQALLLGVQMAGVPVPTARTGTTGGEALSTSSAALATSEATLDKRRAAAAAQKEAIRSLAQSLLSVSAALEGELKDKDEMNDKRKALHSSIDTSVAALRALLALDNLQ